MSQIISLGASGGGGGVLTVNGGNNITSTNPSGPVVSLNLTGTTQFALQVGSAAGALTSLALGTAGQALISNGSGANPSFQTISLATVFPWTVVAVNTNMAVNNGYIANSASLVTLTLPAVAAVGSIVRATGMNTGGWAIAQNAGQTIFFGTLSTTTGVTGGLSSTTPRDAIELVCVVANTSWNWITSQGNITFN
jgi:hypothetical protein